MIVVMAFSVFIYRKHNEYNYLTPECIKFYKTQITILEAIDKQCLKSYNSMKNYKEYMNCREEGIKTRIHLNTRPKNCPLYSIRDNDLVEHFKSN